MKLKTGEEGEEKNFPLYGARSAPEGKRRKKVIIYPLFPLRRDILEFSCFLAGCISCLSTLLMSADYVLVIGPGDELWKQGEKGKNFLYGAAEGKQKMTFSLNEY